jgi:hypothetical protein
MKTYQSQFEGKDNSMRKIIAFFIVQFYLGSALIVPVYSQNAGSAIDHSAHVGDLIHESTIEGYRFAYHLIDIRKNPEEMKNMKDSKQADMTHHLMVYVMDPENRAVEQAKLGYLVVGPDGGKQKLMTMGMQGAFGANVNFEKKGVYTIKTKCLTGDKKLFDSFSYEVK